MTDITELAQRVEHIISDMKLKHGDKDTYAPVMKWDEFLALVKALEKAQQTEKTLESRNRRLDGIITAAEKRIAELESCTVTVKLPTTRLWAGVTECYEKSDVIAAIRSAGMEVSDD